jgi:hypothetical protein
MQNVYVSVSFVHGKQKVDPEVRKTQIAASQPQAWEPSIFRRDAEERRAKSKCFKGKKGSMISICLRCPSESTLYRWMDVPSALSNHFDFYTI